MWNGSTSESCQEDHANPHTCDKDHESDNLEIVRDLPTDGDGDHPDKDGAAGVDRRSGRSGEGLRDRQAEEVEEANGGHRNQDCVAELRVRSDLCRRAGHKRSTWI